MSLDTSIDLLFHEKEAKAKGVSFICGVDEAGRGPLAGPVVAAAVYFSSYSNLPNTINDSKKLTAKVRQEIKIHLEKSAHTHIGIGIINNERIDEINILQATHEAMRQAVLNLKHKIELCLIDGLPVPNFPYPSQNIIKGDSKSLSIASASIIAKETRDDIMRDFAKKFPHYGFEQHKGYGTKKHLEALDKFGACPIHRTSFAPVRKGNK